MPTQPCLVLYSFCANLLHSLIIWLMVSSLSPHNLHLLFSCILSILILIWLVLMALFCAAIRRDSVSLIKFLFRSNVQIFSCEIYYTLLRVFSHQRLLGISHWSFSDTRSHKVSKTVFSILTDLNNYVVWMVSTHPLFSKTSSLCTNPFVIVSTAPFTFCIIVTFMFHSFFSVPYLGPVIFPFFLFYSVTIKTITQSP